MLDVITLDGDEGTTGIWNNLKWFTATVNLVGGCKGVTEPLGRMWVHLLHRPLVYPATEDLTVELYDFAGLATVRTENEVTRLENEVTRRFVILRHFIKIENVFI